MGADGLSTNLGCSMGHLKLGGHTSGMDYRAALGKRSYLGISSPRAGDSEEELSGKQVETGKVLSLPTGIPQGFWV